LEHPARGRDESGGKQRVKTGDMFKFGPNQTKKETFQAVFWLLLVERFEEVADYELTELTKQIDWALAISMALLSALILKGGGQTPGVPGCEKPFLVALLVSIGFGIAAKLWSPRYRFSKPTDTQVRSRINEMNSPTLQEGFFKDMDFQERRFTSFNVVRTFSQAVKLRGEKVPKEVLEGEDEAKRQQRSESEIDFPPDFLAPSFV
jgi:hypothetical protein